MRTAPSLSPPLPETPYVFQRLERVKERLYTRARHHVLDAPRQAWYLHTTATHLAQHVLETYRRRLEAASQGSGLEALPLPLRPYITVATEPYGHTTVHLQSDTTLTAHVVSTLTASLRASEQDQTWDTLAHRLATVEIVTILTVKFEGLRQTEHLETMTIRLREGVIGMRQ